MELFHRIALEEYILAIQINKQDDSEYLKQRVYERYEQELQEESANR
tara:strand:- start:531 stop:671 length:141 start_codon:yes stop_codon:yes gene_type:complete